MRLPASGPADERIAGPYSEHGAQLSACPGGHRPDTVTSQTSSWPSPASTPAAVSKAPPTIGMPIHDAGTPRKRMVSPRRATGQMVAVRSPPSAQPAGWGPGSTKIWSRACRAQRYAAPSKRPMGASPHVVAGACACPERRRVSGQRRRAHRLAQDPWLCPLLPVDRPASLKTMLDFGDICVAAGPAPRLSVGERETASSPIAPSCSLLWDARRSNQPWQSSARRRDSEIRAARARASRHKRLACPALAYCRSGRNAVARDDWADARWVGSGRNQPLPATGARPLRRARPSGSANHLPERGRARTLPGGKRPGDRTVCHGVAYTSVSPRQPRAAIALALSGAGDAVIVNVKELIVERPRPPVAHLVAAPHSTFPSGHATLSAAVYLPLLIVFLTRRPSRYAAIAPLTATVPLVIGIALSRVYPGVHHVHGGVLLGETWTCLVGLSAARPPTPAAKRRLPAVSSESERPASRNSPFGRAARRPSAARVPDAAPGSSRARVVRETWEFA